MSGKETTAKDEKLPRECAREEKKGREEKERCKERTHTKSRV
jgi:hypothetical protein